MLLIPPSARERLVLIAALVCAITAVLVLLNLPRRHSGPPAPAPPATAELVESLNDLSRSMARIVGPAVARVNVDREGDRPIADAEASLPERDWTLPAKDQGSAVIVSPDGFLLTNYHVVHAARRIVVTIEPLQQFEASLVGQDPLSDLALLKIDAQQLATIQWGDSGAVEVGDFVWAIGSPFNLQRSLTFGVLSATDQKDPTNNQQFYGFLQTDAAINPGNSGGPLVDRHGTVIGINTAIFGSSYQGLSFAIPSVVARSVYEDLARSGRVHRGYLGVVLEQLPSGQSDELLDSGLTGVLVSAYSAKAGALSPAKLSGILPGDIIISWDGQQTGDPLVLGRLVAQRQQGDLVKVELLRAGQPQTLEVRVGAQP